MWPCNEARGLFVLKKEGMARNAGRVVNLWSFNPVRVEESRVITRRMLEEFLAKRKSEAENDYEGDN